MQNHPHQPWGHHQQYQQQYPQHGQQYGYGNQPQQAWGWGAGVTQQRAETGADRLAFLKKVYGLFAASVLLSAVGAMIALYAGAETSSVMYEGVRIPPLVALVGGSPIISLVVMLGVVFGASAVRKVRGLNVVALFGMAFILGILFAPSLFVATLNAATGTTISASPIRDAFLLATLMFGGLTGYVALSKKDFSYLGSFLFMGLMVIIGASILNIFLGSSALGLAIASVGLILFAGYVLYDTSRILKAEDRDAVGGAMQLYLDFLNIFLYLLRILGSRR
ncbi:MAG: Bax inhibitor-1/YccA family protein [Polyangiaceae bacterium]